MIAAAVAGGGKLAALLVSLSCTPAVIDGVPADRCSEQVTQSWVAPSPSELDYCSRSASDLRAKGTKAWCELLPADDLGIEPAAERAAPVSFKF